MQLLSHPFTPIAGFESTHYAYFEGRLVWVGDDARVRHPRNYWRPWRPSKKSYNAAQLKVGARSCETTIAMMGTAQGLLAWLNSSPSSLVKLDFPLNHARSRLDAVRVALEDKNFQAFEAAALRLLGLGPGLTPSGDDFLGGIFFALHHIESMACKPYATWLVGMPALKKRLCVACESLTNPISAALLADSMEGCSYGQLHDMLDACQFNDLRLIENATHSLLKLGASSGADMLAGLLLTLTIS